MGRGGGGGGGGGVCKITGPKLFSPYPLLRQGNILLPFEGMETFSATSPTWLK